MSILVNKVNDKQFPIDDLILDLFKKMTKTFTMYIHQILKLTILIKN